MGLFDIAQGVFLVLAGFGLLDLLSAFAGFIRDAARIERKRAKLEEDQGAGR